MQSRTWSPFEAKGGNAWYRFSEPQGTPPTTSSAPTSANTTQTSDNSDNAKILSLPPPRPTMDVSDESSNVTIAQKQLVPLLNVTKDDPESSGSVRPADSDSPGSSQAQKTLMSASSSSGESKFLKVKQDETLSHGPPIAGTSTQNDEWEDVEENSDDEVSILNTGFVVQKDKSFHSYNLRSKKH